jgi:predicted pyridoxine 5'-phosphate oxidase superfamily flavin-nucleotide-binding protein
MPGGYHEGEREAQRRAGVVEAAARLERLARSEIPPAARDFLGEQRLAIVASADESGRLWASAISGVPGFLHAADSRTVRVHAQPADGDPLAHNLEHDTSVALLAIDPRSRRRMRVNGSGRWIRVDELEVRTEEVYANCPKYIRRREPDLARNATRGAAARSRGLGERARALVTSADTFFIATRHPDRGSDASHRGGEPGFVRLSAAADGADLLTVPDYVGNNMFNTLGNLLVEPRAGLLFPDFERGDALLLTGRAEPRWSAAGRELVFRVEEALELPGALGHRWRAL